MLRRMSHALNKPERDMCETSSPGPAAFALGFSSCKLIDSIMILFGRFIATSYRGVRGRPRSREQVLTRADTSLIEAQARL